VKTPTWAQIEQFLKLDGGWMRKRSTKHDFYEKTLPNGETLNTHISHARDKSMHPDTFVQICRLQLRVTTDEFWETLERGMTIRSGAVEVPPSKPPTLAMLMELRRKLHLSDAQLEGMTHEEATRLLNEYHAQARP
jgi:hypothetical protein